MQRLPTILITFLLPAFFSLAQAQQGKLDHVMEAYAGNGSFSGSVLIVKKGNIVLSKGYGYRDVEKKLPNLPNTFFPVGTLTEQFTTEMILSLDSKAALGLEDKLYKYFPDFPNADRISIKNLLTHTSGLYDYSIDPTLLSAKKPLRRADIIECIKNKPLSFYPGTKYGYSAADYFLAGIIIEKVARWDYEDLIKEKLFQPCAMRQSGIDYVNLNEDNKATGYSSQEQDKLKIAPIADTAFSFASFNIYSTAGDLYKFYQGLKWHKLLPQDWQDLAYTPLKDQAALGWKVAHIYNKNFMVHESTIPGFTALELWNQQDDVFIVLLQNNMHPPIPLRNIADNLLKNLYGAEPKHTTTEHSVEKIEEPTEQQHGLNKYLGEFEFTPEFSLKFTIKDNQLFAESPSMKSILMVAEGPNIFRTSGVAAVVEFVKDKNGRINKAILHQGGQDTPGKRIR